MNPKIVVGGVAGVLIAIIVVFTLTGTSIISDVEGGFSHRQVRDNKYYHLLWNCLTFPY